MWDWRIEMTATRDIRNYPEVERGGDVYSFICVRCTGRLMRLYLLLWCAVMSLIVIWACF